LLKERIGRTIAFYRKQFLISEQEIMGIAEQFRDSTRDFRPDLFQEIEALSDAAEVDPLWIYALNGRTELLNLNPMECTSLAFKKTGLIGQNWDWDIEMEELAVILDIENEWGHRIMTMTEPGMIGKIGMNNRGLGVCLNFMTIENYKPKGVPLHVLLRAIMDCSGLAEALSLILPHLKGKVGNLLISNGHGQTENLELAGEEFFHVPVDDLFVHTNHYLTKIDYDLMLFPNTTGRYNRAMELLNTIETPSLSAMKEILKDHSDKQHPICRRRFSHPWLTDDTSMTVTTVIMDLKNHQFHITRGNPFDHPFSVFSLNS
jgi:isopenicillin-N N-acyltransferase-like protein